MSKWVIYMVTFDLWCFTATLGHLVHLFSENYVLLYACFQVTSHFKTSDRNDSK